MVKPYIKRILRSIYTHARVCVYILTPVFFAPKTDEFMK